jgi:hypothetical protein
MALISIVKMPITSTAAGMRNAAVNGCVRLTPITGTTARVQCLQTVASSRSVCVQKGHSLNLTPTEGTYRTPLFQGLTSSDKLAKTVIAFVLLD